MSIFDINNTIDKKYLYNKGFIVFNNHALIWLETNGRYLSHKIEYWYEDNKLVLWGGYEENCIDDIYTISDIELGILAHIEYLKNKYQVGVRIYNVSA